MLFSPFKQFTAALAADKGSYSPCDTSMCELKKRTQAQPLTHTMPCAKMKPMPKIYVKTILLTIAAVVLVELRLNLLTFNFNTVPKAAYDTLIYTCILTIIINEKFTKSEHWNTINYLAFLVLAFAGAIIRLMF